MTERRTVALRLSILVCLIFCVAARPQFVYGTDIEGVQPAALDQPRVNLSLKRTLRGPALSANANDIDAANVQAFLDTGASGILISRTTAKTLGVKTLTAGKANVLFHDIGVGGTEAFGVSEPLFVGIGPSTSIGVAGGREGYPVTIGPVRVQLSQSAGLLDMLTGGLDVVGMPAMKGRVAVLDPKPVDTFGDTMRAVLLDPRKNRAAIPKVDRHVMLSYASFARFTRTEPAGAPGPAMADNPFVGPSPVAPQPAAAGTSRGGSRGRSAKAGIPPVVVTLRGKGSSGSWLLDTGAAASMISTEQAGKVGVTYAPGSKGTAAPMLSGVPEADQFTFSIGGVGGMKKAAGFFLDTLTLPTREGDPLVYKRAPVLVVDITVEDPKTGEKVTLDGVLGMNFFVATASIGEAGLMPDINNLTVGPYEFIVFDEPAGVLGLKLKDELFDAAKAKKKVAKPAPRERRGR